MIHDDSDLGTQQHIHKNLPLKYSEALEKILSEALSADKIKDFKCKECEYKSDQKCGLGTHISTVQTNIKYFDCNQCHHEEVNVDDLNEHDITVHDKIKDFKCKECKYKSDEKIGLGTHISTVHTNIKNFECNQCHDQAVKIMV